MELTIDQALQQGVAAHKEGKLQEADRLYTAILGAQPQHPDANHNMGVLAVGVGKLEQALPFFKTALEANSQIEQYWVSYIDALIKLGQLDNARQILKQGKDNGLKGERINELEVQLNNTATPPVPVDSSVAPSKQQMDHLVSLYSQGHLQEALAQGNALSSQFPDDPSIPNILGAVYSGLGQYEEAVTSYNKAIELKPDFAAAYNNLGIAFKTLGKHHDAIACYNKAIEFKADYPDAHYNLGNILNAIGIYDEAIASYSTTIKLKPNFAEAYSDKGNALREIGEFEEAISNYKRAVELKPNYADPYNNLGVAFNDLGKNDDAIVNYNKAITIFPEYGQAYYNLGITLSRLGKHNNAIDNYNKTVQYKPNYAEAFNNRGVAFKTLGNYEEALASYNKAIEVRPSYAEAFNNLGVTLDYLGKNKEAIISYNKAIALKPTYAEARYNLGLLFYASKKYMDAAEQFKLTDFGKSKYHLLRCFYYLNEKVLFFNLLDNFIKLRKIDPMIGSLTCRSELRYGVERPNLFCRQPLHYVSQTNLNDVCDFEKTFLKTVKIILNENRLPKRQQGLLTNGYQTNGNLFDLEDDYIKEIQIIIQSEIEKYRLKFRDSKEGLIQNWPNNFSLYGWLISMTRGGKLEPHMHEYGWISGSVYINVPSKSKPDSGNLVVCIEDNLIGANEQESIDVITGSLCLFPASLLHYTIPFESEEERIVLAFDIIPK
jgi:tetratricopeptide (TPR) repeat protein